ncbi:unnamed protein product [Toxocara canis]|uniref:G_PROTEIN_RECEP_F1_2 domain-containing protein n=1 Tax=Toxocara canis TaxID=6265 RepID=A0A183V8T0_TOXCA|nr:unnamed protein product [Toxocara canis]
MGSSAAEYCLTRHEMQLSGNEIERIVYGYVVPFFVLFGTIGNVVSLMVLLSPPMRSRSRNLCYLAIVDILFLLLMFPHSLANYEIFAYNFYFRQLYLSVKVHLLALSNWISASAIWLVLLICMERLIGVRYPFHVKKYSTTRDKRCSLLTLAFVLTATGLLTIYTHINYNTLMRTFCNGTQPHAFFIAIDSQTSAFLFHFTI